MARQIKVNELRTALDELEYPISRDEARTACDDVTLDLADGSETLHDIIGRSNDEEFESVDDLDNEIMSLLPRRAVGEPYQSEGEG